MRIHSLVNNTYHARVHMRKTGGGGAPIDVDARPSDAINLAVRFSARILIAKDIAERMSVPIADPLSAASAAGGTAGGGSRPSGAGGRRLTESDAEIVKTCKEECAMYTDPTIIYNLKLQLAVEQEQYSEAAAYAPATLSFPLRCDGCLAAWHLLLWAWPVRLHLNTSSVGAMVDV